MRPKRSPAAVVAHCWVAIIFFAAAGLLGAVLMALIPAKDTKPVGRAATDRFIRRSAEAEPGQLTRRS